MKIGMFYILGSVILLNILIFFIMEANYYNDKIVLSLAFFVGVPFIIGFLFSLIYTLGLIVVEIIKLLTRRKIDWKPFVLLVCEAFFIFIFLFWRTLCPVPDYYKTHLKDLERLALHVQTIVKEENRKNQESIITIPEGLNSIKDRFVQAYIENGVLKINVKLTGSLFGSHSFLLYRSDGKDPDNRDMPFKYRRPYFTRKSKNWCFIDYND